MNVFLSFLFSLSLWLTSCLAQSTWIASSDFVRLIWHNVVVVGEYAYIVGGELTSRTSGQNTYGSFNETLAISLSTSWTNSTVDIQSTDLPSSFPHVKNPTLWFDESSSLIWFFNGETSFIYPTAADPLSIWAFSPDNSGSGTWKENNSPTDSVFNNLTRSYGCGSTYSPMAGYCLGGYSSGYTTPTYDGSGPTIALSGMQIFDFADKSWSNASSVGSSASGWNVWPVLQYVPAYGSRGVLVLIGGSTPTDQSDAQDANGREPLRPMSNVTIYDIHSQQWFSQTATGDVPTGRLLSCFVGAQGGDNSTYEIFVFGGVGAATGPANTDSDQVYILSLPAFRWFRAAASTAPRYGHTCNVIGNRQMLSFGGNDPTTTNQSIADPFTYGLGVFDMTEWTWNSSYVPDAKSYQPASQISQFYSTNSKYPSWDDPALQAIIEANTTTSTSQPTSSPTSSPSSTTPTSSKSSSTPAGAIAGGVVGGITFFVLIGLGIWIFKRKRRPRGGGLPVRFLPAEMSDDPRRAELGQDPAELGPDLRHELGPGSGEMVSGTTHRAGMVRGAGETECSELAAW